MSIGKRMWSLISFFITCAIIGFFWKDTRPKPLFITYNNPQVDEKLLKGLMPDSTVIEQSIDSGNCNINTSELPKSNGIKMIIYYPCSWEEINNNNYVPTLIKQLIYESSEDYSIFLSFDITKISTSVTPEFVDKVTNDQFLRKATKDFGEYISSKKISINGVNGDEVINRLILKGGSGVSYKMTIQLYYKNNLISIAYGVGSDKESIAASVFKIKKNFFEVLASKTKFQ